MTEKYDIMQDIMEKDIDRLKLEEMRPPQDILESLHYEKERTLADIGRIYGIAARDVYKWFKYYNMSKNNSGPISDYMPSRDTLKNKYYKRDMFLRELGEYYGISKDTVENWIKRYELTIKKHDVKIKEKNKETLPDNLPSAEELKELNRKGKWQMSEQGKRARAIDAHVRKTKNGLYASIPIICQGSSCPFSGSCHLLQIDEAPKGDLCAIEINTIEDLMENYSEELDVSEDDMVDLSMLRDVIDIDISLMRVNRRLAENPDVVEDVIAGIGDDGTAYERPEVNKAYELQGKLMKQRRRLLKELHATRKEKAQDDKDVNINISDTLTEFKKRLKGEDDQVIDVNNEQSELDKIEEEIDIEEVEVTNKG